MTQQRLIVWKIRFFASATLAVLAITAAAGLMVLPRLVEAEPVLADSKDDAATEPAVEPPAAPAPAPGRIAVIDLEKVKDRYQKYIDGDKRISTREKELQEQLDKYRAPLDELKKQRDAQPHESDAWFDYDNKLRDKAAEYETAAKKAQAEITRADLELMEEIIGDITAAIGKHARAEGIGIVLWKKQVLLNHPSLQQRTAYLELISVLYADSRLDITGAVIERLNSACGEKD